VVGVGVGCRATVRGNDFDTLAVPLRDPVEGLDAGTGKLNTTHRSERRITSSTIWKVVSCGNASKLDL